MVQSVDTVIREQLQALGALESHELLQSESRKLFQSINLSQLISFDILIQHHVCTEHCKQLKKTTAVMVFKIAEVSPLAVSSSGARPEGFVTKRIECSLDELKNFREDIQRIQDNF